jgi:hypothetical protein
MRCARCPHAHDEHVFGPGVVAHVCKLCTCAAFTPQVYEAPWGRYEALRMEDGKLILKEVGSHSYVYVTAEKLAADYREVNARPAAAPAPTSDPLRDADIAGPKKPKNRKTKANAAAGMLDLFANPVAPDAAPIPLEVLPPPVVKVRHAAPAPSPPPSGGAARDDEPGHRDPAAPPRVWVGPALTLGAVPPGGSKVSWPDRLLQYWIPCAVPFEGAPHAWFIGDNLDPHIYCDGCLEQKLGAPREAASIPADHPRALTWALWSWTAVSAGQDNEPEPVTVPHMPGAGLPPWVDDVDGKPLWERVGGKRGTALREWFTERAAIMQFCGNMTREEADYRAYGNLLDTARRHEIA